MMSIVQTSKLYDDVVVKLPIVIQYGEEAEWDEEEKARVLGEEFVFGCQDEDSPNIEEETIVEINVEEGGEAGVTTESDSNKKDEPEHDGCSVTTEEVDDTPGIDAEEKDAGISANEVAPNIEEGKGENNKANETNSYNFLCR